MGDGFGLGFGGLWGGVGLGFGVLDRCVGVGRGAGLALFDRDAFGRALARECARVLALGDGDEVVRAAASACEPAPEPDVDFVD